MIRLFQICFIIMFFVSPALAVKTPYQVKDLTAYMMKNPVYAEIYKHEPGTLEEEKVKLKAVLDKGVSKSTFEKAVKKSLWDLYDFRLPMASDVTVLESGDFYLRRLRYVAKHHPKHCQDAFFMQPLKIKMKKFYNKKTQAQEYRLMTDAVRTFVPKRKYISEEKGIEYATYGLAYAKQELGEDVYKLMTSKKKKFSKEEHVKRCRGYIFALEATNDLPREKAVWALRFLRGGLEIRKYIDKVFNEDDARKEKQNQKPLGTKKAAKKPDQKTAWHENFETLEEAQAAFSSTPIQQAFMKHQPKIYEYFMYELSEAWNKKKTIAEARQNIAKLIKIYVAEHMPYADDDVIVDYYKHLLEELQLIQKKYGDEACYTVAKGGDLSTEKTLSMPYKMKRRYMDLVARIIETADRDRDLPPIEVAEEATKQMGLAMGDAFEDFSHAMHLIFDREAKNKADMKLGCAAEMVLYETVIKLGGTEGASLIRMMYYAYKGRDHG